MGDDEEAEGHYQVNAVRSGKWWALEFPNNAGVHSQVKGLDHAAEVAAEALSFSLNVVIPASEINIEVTLTPELDTAIQDATRSRLAAATATDLAKEAMVTAVTTCSSYGLSTRDIGQLIGISHQYAAKILQQANRQGANQ